MGIVKKGETLKKLEQRGFDGIKVGNVDGHAKGVHRVCNLNTGLVNVVRDVKWLNKMHHECRRDTGKEETEEGSDSSSEMGQKAKGEQDEGEEVKVKLELTSEDWREVEEDLITSMS